jgi:hypothetical protein
MNFEVKERLGFFAIALFNAVYTFPAMKKMYKRFYSNQAVPTHYVRKLMTDEIGLFRH